MQYSGYVINDMQYSGYVISTATQIIQFQQLDLASAITHNFYSTRIIQFQQLHSQILVKILSDYTISTTRFSLYHNP